MCEYIYTFIDFVKDPNKRIYEHNRVSKEKSILFVYPVSADTQKMALGSNLGESLGEELKSLCSPTFW